LEPVEGGDVRLQTLNVVNADKASKYQLGEDDKLDIKETEKDIKEEDNVV